MKASGRRGAPQRGPRCGVWRKSRRPCCCVAMQPASRRGAPARTRGRGQQPKVKTSGKRKGYKVFGLIASFTGRFFYQGQDGRLNSTAYIAFLRRVLEHTTQPLLLIQDGARSHTSA